MSTTYDIQLIAPGILIGTSWWNSLHPIILQAYQPTRDDWPLPKAFQRLDADITKAYYQLCEELGPNAMLAISFQGREPVACAALQRFKIIRQSDVDAVAAKPASTSASTTLDTGAPAAQGENATDAAADPSGRWEITLVTTALAHRNQGLARSMVRELEEYVVRHYGAVQLLVRTVDELSGAYWRKLGFATVDEYCITLPKGFSHVQDAPDELRMERAVYLWTGKRDVGS